MHRPLSLPYLFGLLRHLFLSHGTAAATSSPRSPFLAVPPPPLPSPHLLRHHLPSPPPPLPQRRREASTGSGAFPSHAASPPLQGS
ncbi:hypothetical protein PAHAL_9G238300 [Panicum hallii]|uniref:Uncharacterized protein n=1 Tax=Panicum hallii TaxID=206008 RepID=A0A2S3ILY1_9POAL|nr:hypothetical protein PAHAL_9G238300 [Panicum hallii]